jgi:hypothetical protein
MVVCDLLGVPFGTVRARIARGWDVDKALITPPYQKEAA